MIWIKVVTNMFEDEKFKIIESMQDRDLIESVWLKLLCMCGKQDRGGYIRISNDIGIERSNLTHLALLLNRTTKEVERSLEVLEMFGMIGFDECGLFVCNWEKHQSVDNSHKEYMRQYMAERRKKAKDKPVEKKEKQPKKEKAESHKYGVYKHVLLTDEQYQKLKEEHSDADDIIKFFDEQCEAKGYKYKNYYQAIKNWGIEAYSKRPKKTVYTLDEMNVPPTDIEKIRRQMFKKG